jgi:transposase-like protein
MFQITVDPSSGRLLQCLAKNYKNDSIVSIDMDSACNSRTTGQNMLP